MDWEWDPAAHGMQVIPAPTTSAAIAAAACPSSVWLMADPPAAVSNLAGAALTSASVTSGSVSAGGGVAAVPAAVSAYDIGYASSDAAGYGLFDSGAAGSRASSSSSSGGSAVGHVCFSDGSSRSAPPSAATSEQVPAGASAPIFEDGMGGGTWSRRDALEAWLGSDAPLGLFSRRAGQLAAL